MKLITRRKSHQKSREEASMVEISLAGNRSTQYKYSFMMTIFYIFCGKKERNVKNHI